MRMGKRTSEEGERTRQDAHANRSLLDSRLIRLGTFAAKRENSVLPFASSLAKRQQHQTVCARQWRQARMPSGFEREGYLENVKHRRHLVVDFSSTMEKASFSCLFSEN